MFLFCTELWQKILGWSFRIVSSNCFQKFEDGYYATDFHGSNLIIPEDVDPYAWYCLTLNIRELADATAVVNNIQHSTWMTWLGFGRTYKKGFGGTRYVLDCFHPDHPYPDNVHCVFIKAYLPSKGRNYFMMVQLANNIPGKFECINSYGPKDPTPIIEIGIPKV